VNTAATLTRETFITSRLLEYFSEKELTLQTGHEPDRWPEVVLKELLDNALDACEDAGTLPEIVVTIASDRIAVADNGPGLPAVVVERILDYGVRVSSKDAYVSPSRGAQGNALKTVLAIPFVLGHGAPARIVIESQGQAHAVTVGLDRIDQAPHIRHRRTASSVKTGTRVTVPLPRLEGGLHGRFLPLVESYALLNPHASLLVRCGTRAQRFDRTASACRKWKPSDPTSAHWYAPEQLRGLMAAYVSAERRGGPALTVRDFIGQFRGLTSTRKRKAILATRPALAAVSLSTCVSGGDIDETIVAALLDAMRAESKPVNPLDLGVLGQAHLQSWLTAHGGVAATIVYKRVADLDERGLPFVVEVAFGAREDRDPRRVIVGINAAPTLNDPFRELADYHISLDGLLQQQLIRATSPVTCVVHLTHPALRYTDRGKSALEGVRKIGDALHQAVTSATKSWAAVEKKKIRDEQRGWRASQRYFRGLAKEPSIREAAMGIMDQAYLKASGQGRYPTTARQVMYAARPLILASTEKPLGQDFDKYFTQSLLPAYMREQATAAAWNVVYDARGHFAEPHTDTVVSLGTVDVRAYLAGAHNGAVAAADPVPSVALPYPTHGPQHRYQSVLFLEKEGFNELLAAAQIAERFDLAIMSTKGYSSTSARTLIERLAGVRILVLHDFDKDGLGILHTLQHDTIRYRFAQRPEIIDLGIRLADVTAERLAAERVTYRRNPIAALQRYGATAPEIHVLRRERVELNAFTSDAFIAWLERKLQKAGVKKVVPEPQTLADAYRRAVMLHHINAGLEQLEAEARTVSDGATIPRGLATRIRARLKQQPARAWDAVLADIAAEGQS
jgi:DNA topoisomerase VI subunit B